MVTPTPPDEATDLPEPTDDDRAADLAGLARPWGRGATRSTDGEATTPAAEGPAGPAPESEAPEPPTDAEPVTPPSGEPTSQAQAGDVTPDEPDDAAPTAVVHAPQPATEVEPAVDIATSEPIIEADPDASAQPGDAVAEPDAADADAPAVTEVPTASAPTAGDEGGVDEPQAAAAAVTRPDPATQPSTTVVVAGTSEAGLADVGTEPAAATERRLLVGAALIAGFAAFALARWALLPGLGFWDTGEFQVVGPVLGTAHPTGFPAYVLLSWLASVLLQPFGDPAFRINLLSAILVGGATALTVILVRQLTGHLWIALASGLVLAAVPIVWNIGTHADAHALHVLLVALLFVLLVGWERRVRRGRNQPVPNGRLRRPGDRWLLAAAMVYGIGLANHTLMLLLAPGIALYVLATAPGILRRPAFIVGLAASLFLVAAALYLELPLRAGPFRAPLVYGHPETLDGFLYVVLAQQFVGALYQPFADLGDKTVALAKLGYEQFGLLVGLVPLAFVTTIWRQPRYALLSGVSFLVTAWFAASYVNADISRYYLGPVVMAVTWLALLAAEVAEWLVRLLRAGSDTGRPWLGTAGPAALVLEVAVCIALLTPTAEAIPDRAATADLSGQHSAGEWADAAMQLFEPDAVVISWWSYSTTLWYAQIIGGQRPDVWIVDDRTRLDDNLGDVTDVIDAELGKRPVYLVRLGGDDLTALENRYEVRGFDMPTEQPILQVTGRK
jgi:hypothetical protein